MKEITTEMTLKITWVEKVKNKDEAEYVEHNLDQEIQKAFAETLREALEADNVDISEVHHTVVDVTKKKRMVLPTEVLR